MTARSDRHILAILTPARIGDTLLHAALAEARATGARLTVVYLEDQDRQEHLRECLTTRGFVGAGQTRAIGDLAHACAQSAGAERLAEVSAAAQEAGVPCVTRMASGRFADSILRLATDLGADRVFVSRGRIGPLSRLFGERDFTRLRRHLGPALQLVEPELRDSQP